MDENMDNAITLENVRFRYPRGSFIFSVDTFSLRAGEICIIQGQNGSGKSTLLKLCTGILHAEKMKLTLFGNDASEYSLGQIGKYVGYLFQEPSKQIFTATVWEEMTFIAAIREEDPKEIAQKAMILLDRFSLKHLAKRSTYRLSRGEKQRLALASILMQNIHYLMLDEPTTGLDFQNRQTLYSVIDELLKAKLGIAIISHDSELFERFPNARIVTIKEGETIA